MLPTRDELYQSTHRALAALVVVFGCLLATASVVAHDDTPTPLPLGVDQRISTPDPEDQLVCRREVTTGTHFAQRVCRTKRQIREEREASQRELQKVQQRTNNPRDMGG